MQTLEHGESTDSGFAATLQKFGALSLADQLPILTYALRDEPIAGARTARAPAAVAIRPPGGLLQVLEADFLQPAGDGAGSHRRVSPRGSGPSARALALTMTGSFVLALAVMRWERPAGGLMPPVFAVVPAPEPARAPAAAPVAAPVATPDHAPPINAIAHSPDLRPMPVTLQFRRRGFHSDPGDRRKINWFTEGRVTNNSDEPMVIEVRVAGAGALSASQIQLSVAAHTDRDFGKDDGLEMHPGDKVTLISAPYADLEAGGVR